MENVIIFESDKFGQIRTAGTSENPLFCLSDICKVLELQTGRVKQRLNQDGITLSNTIDSLGREQQLVFINEQNLYKVIMRSNKPQAEAFQDWVCGEVLPSIRKTGYYSTSPDRMKELDIEEMKARKGIADSLRELMNIETLSPSWKQILAAKSAEILSGGEKILPLPKSEVSYSATDIAKELGTSSTMVDRIAKANNLKTKEYGEWYHDKSRYSNKEVDVFRYNQKGFDIIRNIFLNRFG